MKILLNYLGRTGSGPLLAFEMARALLQNGHEVTAVVSSGTSNLKDWQSLQGIQLYPIPTYTDVKSLAWGTLRFLFKERPRLRRTFCGRQFDMVYVPMCHLWGAWVDGCFPHCRRVVTVHDPKPHTGASRIESALFQWQCRQADDLVVLSRQFIPEVQQLYQKPATRIHYIPHGAAPSYRLKQKGPAPVQFAPDKTNFVFVGRIEEYKGLHVLAQAFGQLAAIRQDATLTVAGKGNFLPYADEYAALPRTTVLNRYVNEEELGWFFDGPNIVIVLPYLDATQSGNVPVAMEYGCTLLATKTGGLQEQIEEGKTGFLVEPGDPRALMEGMLWIMEHPAECAAMRAGYPAVLEGLQWPILANRLTDLVKDA